MSRGTLSLVATPIGNLEDITLRALRTLKEAELVLAEDTRQTAKLLRAHGVETRCRAYHAHSSEAVQSAIVAALAEGAHYALVTDAGTPLISDPGEQLAAAARDAGVEVAVVPGVSALTTALMLAGYPALGALFLGFPPRSGSRRKALLARCLAHPETVVLFESPKRLPRLLADLAALQPEREAALCRELTKHFEERRAGPLAQLAEIFSEAPKGECTLVLAPASMMEDPFVLSATQEAQLRDRLVQGEAPSALRAELQQQGMSRADAYALLMRFKPG